MWDRDPRERPAAIEVLMELQDIASDLMGPAPAGAPITPSRSVSASLAGDGGALSPRGAADSRSTSAAFLDGSWGADAGADAGAGAGAGAGAAARRLF